VLMAPVIGHTPSGNPVLAFTPAQPQAGASPSPVLLQISRAVAASAGQWLAMEIIASKPLQAGLPTIGQNDAYIDALTDLLPGLVGEAMPQANGPSIISLLPKAGAQALPPPLLLLLSALRGGDVAQWMGAQGVEWLRTHQKQQAVERLKAGFEAASANRQREADQPAGDWKTSHFPLFHDQQVHKIMLHTRAFASPKEEDEAADKQETGIRFVMDMDLSRMGPLQIEGFVVHRTLDMTIRTEQGFSGPMQSDLRSRYKSSLEAVGFSGRLHFHASLDHKGWLAIAGQTIATPL